MKMFWWIWEKVKLKPNHFKHNVGKTKSEPVDLNNIHVRLYTFKEIIQTYLIQLSQTHLQSN